MIDLPEKEHWYALRIFHNKIGTIKARIDRCGFQSYIPMRTVERITEGRLKHVAEPVIPSLLFIRTPRSTSKPYEKTLQVTPAYIVFPARRHQRKSPITKWKSSCL